MSTQWHPLFAYLLRLSVEAYYEVSTETPVGDLPRRADLLLVRRTAAQPPFVGQWGNLTSWNVLEYKGPTDDPEEADLELLLHVGTGLTCRFNEERRVKQEAALANRDVSFWYLARSLGPTFLGEAQMRTALSYQTGDLWTGRVWGHPLFLVSYRDLPVEPETVPLHLLTGKQPAHRELGELVVRQVDLTSRFSSWLSALHPELWKEIRHMATSDVSTKPTLDWATLSRHVDFRSMVEVLGTHQTLELLGGIDRLLEDFGIERVLQIVGVERLIQIVGLGRLIDIVGLERLGEVLGPERAMKLVEANLPLELLLSRLTPEQRAYARNYLRDDSAPDA